jgi:hypothetical protein
MTPLHRSRSFWVGIVVLAGIVLMWVDSMHRECALTIHRGVFIESYMLVHREGAIELACQQAPPALRRAPWQIGVYRDAVEPYGEWFRGAGWKVQQYPVTKYRELVLPYWLIALAWLAGCYVFAWRRQRRMLATTQAIPEPES